MYRRYKGPPPPPDGRYSAHTVEAILDNCFTELVFCGLSCFRMAVSKTGKPPAFSTIFISFHRVDGFRKNVAANGKTCETTDYKLRKAVIQKLLLWYIRCTARLEWNTVGSHFYTGLGSWNHRVERETCKVRISPKNRVKLWNCVLNREIHTLMCC